LAGYYKVQPITDVIEVIVKIFLIRIQQLLSDLLMLVMRLLRSKHHKKSTFWLSEHPLMN